MTSLRAGAATDVGRVREVNEDRYLVADGIFAVADGVGGHQAGEIASQTSVETLRDGFVEHTTEGLVEAVTRANDAVWRLAQERPDRRGMGTTLSVLALVADASEDLLAVANVGDSRVYLLGRGEFLQVTRDHSLVEEMVREGRLTAAEASVHPQRSIITRALGMESDVEVDTWELVPNRGDRFLLCSDGLTNELPDDRIAATLRRFSDPAEAARELVRQARAEGGGDNITAVVVDVVDDGDRAEKASALLGRTDASGASPRVDRTVVLSDTQAAPAVSPASAPGPTFAGPGPMEEPPGRSGRGPRLVTWRSVLFGLLLTAVIAAAAGAVNWYARGTYFVRIDGDSLAAYQGRPNGLLWFEPNQVKAYQLDVRTLQSGDRARLARGQQFTSLEDADRHVTRLAQEAQRRESTTTSLPVAIPDSADPTVSSSVP